VLAPLSRADVSGPDVGRRAGQLDDARRELEQLLPAPAAGKSGSSGLASALPFGLGSLLGLVAAQAPAAAPGGGAGGGDAGAARASAPGGAIPGLRLLEMGGGSGGGGGVDGGGGGGGARAATTVLGDIDEVRLGWAWQGRGAAPGCRRTCPLLASPPACASPLQSRRPVWRGRVRPRRLRAAPEESRERLAARR